MDIYNAKFLLTNQEGIWMKKIIGLIGISLTLLFFSITPLLNIVREFWIDYKLNERYEIDHAYRDTQGFNNIVDVQELTINDMSIQIIEEKTNKKAPLTYWDKNENVPPGDIVKIHLLLNEKEISIPDEIWLSNRNKGSRYYSWIDIVTVTDGLTGKKQINIVQRLTDDNHPMEKREWKLITISQNGVVSEDVIKYFKRSENKLGVKLINFSGTSLMSLGYYSDNTQGYPSLFFPFLYPFFTGIAGFIMLIMSLILFYKRRSKSWT